MEEEYLNAGTSRTRRRLAAVLRRAGALVTPSVASEALGVDRAVAAKTLGRWANQGWLKRLRRGVYAPVPPDSLLAAKTLTNPWILVPRIFDPAYVGGWSAAEHWHLTEQIFSDICVFTARSFRKKRVSLEGTTFLLQRTESDRLFGLRSIWEGRTRIAVSDPHRTLIDMFDRPSIGGGIRHVEACLTEYLKLPDSDPSKLLAYGDQLGSGAVFKRLGFLLERASGDRNRAVAECRKRLTAGNARLDPALPGHRLVTRWRLWVPKSWAEARP